MSVAGLLIGLGLIAIAAVIAVDVSGMRVPPVHAKVGPRFFPLLISCGLAVGGVATVWQSWRGTFEDETPAATDWFAVALISAGLVLHMNLMKPAGFVPAAVVLFMSVTTAFGSRKFLRDGIVALVLALAAYLAFTRLLGLQLPAGLLQGII
jgi:putative tricarboxylic transport membrane protein